MFSTFISDNYFLILNRDLEGFLVPLWRSVKCDITRVFYCLKTKTKCWMESA